MTISSNTLPDIIRPDVSTVLVSQWAVGTPERQRAAADAMITEWKRAPQPEGFISFNCLASTDGETLLNYTQWTGNGSWREFIRAARPALVRGIEDAVPGVRPPEPVEYQLYRSSFSHASQVPGCIVIVSIETDGAELARQWVDTVIGALNADPEPRPGWISAHFHVSADGTQVLNYAEWIDEQAHREALEDSAPLSAEWRRVQNMPGVRHLGFKRYYLHRSVAGQPPEVALS